MADHLALTSVRPGRTGAAPQAPTMLMAALTAMARSTALKVNEAIEWVIVATCIGRDVIATSETDAEVPTTNA